MSNDWVVRYHNRLLQLERQSGQAPARSTVVVCEDVAGRIEIRYRDHVMRWTDITGAAVMPPTTIDASMAVPPPTPAVRGPRAGADHPWRQGFKHMGRDAPYWQLVDR